MLELYKCQKYAAKIEDIKADETSKVEDAIRELSSSSILAAASILLVNLLWRWWFYQIYLKN